MFNVCKYGYDDDRGEEMLEFRAMACMRWAVGVSTCGGLPGGLLPSGA